MKGGENVTYEEFMNKIINSGRERPKNFSDKKRGYENHHIIPKCMGGSNKTDNLIRLTIPEHLVAHILLFRENPNNHGLANAATGMMGKNEGFRDYVATIVDNEEEFYEIINALAKSREETRDYMATIMRDKNAGANNHQACAVICLETRETFATIRSASESVGLKDISRALKSIALTAGGYLTNVWAAGNTYSGTNITKWNIDKTTTTVANLPGGDGNPYAYINTAFDPFNGNGFVRITKLPRMVYPKIYIKINGNMVELLSGNGLVSGGKSITLKTSETDLINFMDINDK